MRKERAVSVFYFNLTELALKRKITAAERFQAKVGKQLPTGCMEWDGYRMGKGYGIFSFAKRKPILAHRFAYLDVYGEIPKGMVIMHKCDNPACVNIDHLRLGTQLENIADMKEKKRSRRSKLLPHIDAILAMHAKGYTQQRIAKEYGVSRPLVNSLLTGKLLINRS